MLRKFGMLVMLMVLGLGAVGIAQEDGSVIYPSGESKKELDDFQPQVHCYWKLIGFAIEQDWTYSHTEYNLCLWTWRCLGDGLFNARHYYRVVRWVYMWCCYSWFLDRELCNPRRIKHEDETQWRKEWEFIKKCGC